VLSTVPWQVVVDIPLCEITAGTDLLKRRLIGSNVAISLGMRYLYLSPNYRSALGARFRDPEHRIRHKELGYRWFLANGSTICDGQGNVSSAIGIARDITKRKEQKEELVTLLNEKNHLMQEVHHRVKNNLAMVVALIRIKQTEPGNRVDLADLRSQIDTIRIVREQLKRTQEVTRINAREYIQDLLEQDLLEAVFSSFSAQDVELQTLVRDITLPSKTAVTLVYIINEAATNAIKYSFGGDEPARFSTELSVDERTGRFVLVMSNTGNPFPEDID